MRAFVTGATGFIGRRLVARLQADGTDVTALVRNETQALPTGVKSVRGDVLTSESFRDAGEGCDRLYHLAAMITFDERKREALIRTNGHGTANVLKAACRWGVARSVVVSSACTMGLSYARESLLDEDSPPTDELERHNPYLASKLAAERAAESAAREHAVVVANPTTVYGPGDWTLNSGALVSRVARSSVMPVPSGGSNVVDVDDVVDGILAVGERGRSGCRYILGGHNLLFREIVSTIADVVGRRPVMVDVPGWARSPMSVAASFAGRLTGSRFLTGQIVSDMFAFKYYSSLLAENELQWRAKRSFRESVERAWEFYLKERLIVAQGKA